MKVNKCRDFARERDYGAFSIVRVCNGALADLGGRGAWVAIENGKGALFRRVLGAGASGLTADAIELDYDSRLDLGVHSPFAEDGFCSCNLTIRPATREEKVKAHWSHPSLAYRVPYRLAVLSVLLGLLGLILGVTGLIVGLTSV